jgi:hypothetical protein
VASNGRPPVWTTLLVVVGSLAVVALALVALSDRTAGESEPEAMDTPAATPSPVASATPTASTSATPVPSGEPTPGPDFDPTATPAASPVPLVTVDVLNQSGVSELAGRTSAVLADAGWSVGRVDNATLGSPSSTLYVPDGLEAAADAFVAQFAAVTRTRPAFEGLVVDGLTLVLAQPDAQAVVQALEASAADVPTPVGASP